MELPILLTGCPRSGTTWAGRTLARAGGVCHVHEPFNPTQARGYLPLRNAQWYPYVCDSNDKEYYSAVKFMLSQRYSLIADWRRWFRSPRELRRSLVRKLEFERCGKSGSVVLVKDPVAVLSAEWLHRRFGFRIVWMVRHPAAFVSSVKRLGWTTDYSFWLNSPELVAELNEDIVDLMREAAGGQCDVVKNGAITWLVIHHMLQRFLSRNQDFMVVKHEELSRDPVFGFRTLYNTLNLEFSDAVQNWISDKCTVNKSASNPDAYDIRRNSGDNISVWKTRLEPSEINLIRSLVEPLSLLYYGEDDW